MLHQKTKDKIFQFKIVLKDTNPPVWRRIQVPTTYTFWALHVAIQDSMGWWDSHLHKFDIQNSEIGIPPEEKFYVRNQKILPGWKKKDAWDIYSCLKNYPGGLDTLAESFQEFLSQGLVQEGLEKISEKFVSEEHVGPKFVADFEEISDVEERAFLQRDAFEKVHYLLVKLGVKKE